MTFDLGGLGNSAATDLEVDLSFLGDGEWNAAIWRDSPDSVANPSIIAVEDRTIDLATKNAEGIMRPRRRFRGEDLSEINIAGIP